MINTNNIAKTSIVQKEVNYLDILNTKMGSLNIKVSCFINSCIQVLIHCKPLMELFFWREVYRDNNLSIAYKIFNICRDMQNGNRSLDKYIDISSFNYFFSVKHSYFGP